MKRRRILKTLLIVLSVLTLVGCDRATKVIAKETLAFSSPRDLWGGFVVLHYVENPGGFLGIGSTIPSEARYAVAVVLSVVVVAALVGLLLFAHRLEISRVFAFTVIIAGAIGNLVDHLFNVGGVADFILLSAGPMHTGIFNVADVLISGGITLLLVAGVRDELRKGEDGGNQNESAAG